MKIFIRLILVLFLALNIGSVKAQYANFQAFSIAGANGSQIKVIAGRTVQLSVTVTIAAPVDNSTGKIKPFTFKSHLAIGRQNAAPQSLGVNIDFSEQDYSTAAGASPYKSKTVNVPLVEDNTINKAALLLIFNNGNPYANGDQAVQNPIYTVAVDNNSVAVNTGGNTVRLIRYYNMNTGQHFYTCDQTESNRISSEVDGLGKYIWRQEGFTAYVIPSSTPQANVPWPMAKVYRMRQSSTNDHVYTLSYSYVQTMSSQGWVLETTSSSSNWVFWAIDPASISSVPSSAQPVRVYQYFNRYYGAGHFYTQDYSELGGGDYIWQYDTIAFYGYGTDVSFN